MSNKKLSGKALVIQITREEIRIGQMRLGQANPELQASLLLPTPEGAVEDGEIRNLTALKDALRPALEDPVFRRTRRCVFVLCSSRVISASTKLPAKQKGARLGQVLQANMDEYFPVQTEDYLLTWEHAGYTMEDGFRESVIQLWAVPRLVVSRYYELAAGLGLTVASIDYCGNAAAAAAGVSFSGAGKKMAKAPKQRKKLDLNKEITFGKKKKKAAEVDETAVAVMEPSVETAADAPVLYLHIDDDSIITTFVSEGQVKLQRLVQRGFSLDADLGETSISMEYFNALPETAAPVGRVVLSGSAAQEAEECGVEELLGVPTEHLECMPDPSWALVLGASRTKLDFGIPDLSRDGSEAKLWQFGLVFGGGAALVAVVMLFMTSSLTWSTELGGLRNTQNQLMILAQQNSGAAQAYYDYESAYNAYSSDWATIYGTETTPGAVRTYNDNLVLILEELEEHIPTSAAVTTFNMTDQSISAQVAFKKLEDVAYFIQKLRNMNYANLDGISSISIGPYYTAEMLRAMQQQSADASGDLAALLGMSGASGLSGLTGGMSTDEIAAMISGASSSGTGIDMEQLGSLLALAGITESAPTEGSNDGVAAASVEAPPTEGSLESVLGMVGIKDTSMDSLLPILVEVNGGPLSLKDLQNYYAIMEAVESGNIEDVDTGVLTDILNAADKNNGGSGNRFTETQVEILLGLLDGSGIGSSGSSNSSGNNKDDDDDDDDGDDIKVSVKDPDALTQMLESHNITVDTLRLNLQNLTKNQLNVLQNEYGTKQSSVFDEDDLEDMLDDATTSEKKAAIKNLLKNDKKNHKDDPAAMYRFFLLLREDMEREEKKQILYDDLEKFLKNNDGVYDMLFESTQKDLDKYLEDLIDKVSSSANYKDTIELIMTDDKLSSKYAAHLAYAMEDIKKVDTSLDMEQILEDLETGNVMKKSSSVQDAVLALLDADTRALYKAMVKTESTGTNSGLNIGDILGGQTTQQQIQPEIRYFLTVSLSYDESLIQAELARKGLDYSSKVGKLEVSA